LESVLAWRILERSCSLHLRESHLRDTKASEDSAITQVQIQEELMVDSTMMDLA